VLVLTLAVAGAASGAATPAGGRVEVFATPVDTAVGPVMFAGAIGDHGKAISMDKNGKLDPNGDFVKMKLAHGTFVLDVTRLNAKGNSNSSPGLFNKTTCSFAFEVSAPATISQGTGSYAGISGTLRITVRFAGDSTFYASGKHKGQCNLSDNAHLAAHYGAIIGSGTVKFS
jgi:hypothetical protein